VPYLPMSIPAAAPGPGWAPVPSSMYLGPNAHWVGSGNAGLLVAGGSQNGGGCLEGAATLSRSCLEANEQQQEAMLMRPGSGAPYGSSGSFGAAAGPSQSSFWRQAPLQGFGAPQGYPTGHGFAPPVVGQASGFGRLEHAQIAPGPGYAAQGLPGLVNVPAHMWCPDQAGVYGQQAVPIGFGATFALQTAPQAPVLAQEWHSAAQQPQLPSGYGATQVRCLRAACRPALCEVPVYRSI
jgi:hypothetical protein